MVSEAHIISAISDEQSLDLFKAVAPPPIIDNYIAKLQNKGQASKSKFIVSKLRLEKVIAYRLIILENYFYDLHKYNVKHIYDITCFSVHNTL